MTSAVPESTDVALSAFSLMSSLFAICAVPAIPEKNLSESMLKVAQFTKDHLPQGLLPTFPYNTNQTLQLGALFVVLATFWITEMAIYIRRDRRPLSMTPPFILSIIILLIAKFNLAEYLLVCLPTSMAVWEVAILGAWYGSSGNQRKNSMTEYSKEKTTVEW